MRDEDLLRCPLLQGLDSMHRAQLLGLLNNSCVREKVETCLTEYLQSPASIPINPPHPDTHVAHWQLDVPMRRSAKE